MSPHPTSGFIYMASPAHTRIHSDTLADGISPYVTETTPEEEEEEEDDRYSGQQPAVDRKSVV